MTTPAAAIITISDRCARGERLDRSGPAVSEAASALGLQVRGMEVVPDELEQIVARLRHWSDCELVELILTSGGTGCAPRDVTPEATRAVVDREVPGLAELMRLRGLEVTPLAALSRAICGIRGRTLIVNLPGSPLGAVQSLQAVATPLKHALELIRELPEAERHGGLAE